MRSPEQDSSNAVTVFGRLPVVLTDGPDLSTPPLSERVIRYMRTDGTRVRTSAEIDANCRIDHEVVGGEAFFSFADGTVSLHFTDEESFRNLMTEAVTVLATLGLRDAGDANS